MPAYKVAVNRHALDRKLPHGDPFWPTFNASFQNLELEPFDLGRMIYDGHAFTTWHDNNWRHSQNFLAGQHLGLDFDNGDQTCTLLALLGNPFVRRYANILYTTPSHTPEAPRARVVFLLDQPIVQAKNYALAAAAMLWMFGTADRQCKDPVRFFYGSLRCETELLDNVLPLETVKRIIQQYQAIDKPRHLARSLTATTDQAEVADALKLIPAWGIEYDEWVAVLMALHREYGDAGLALAEQWANGADNEVSRKWRSFKTTGNVTGTVGLGTVFALAQRFGWARAAAE